jgi:hypothetical protein
MKYLVIRKVSYTTICDSHYIDYHDGFDTLEIANEYAQLQAKLQKSTNTTYTVVPLGNVE